MNKFLRNITPKIGLFIGLPFLTIFAWQYVTYAPHVATPAYIEIFGLHIPYSNNTDTKISILDRLAILLPIILVYLGTIINVIAKEGDSEFSKEQIILRRINRNWMMLISLPKMVLPTNKVKWFF